MAAAWLRFAGSGDPNGGDLPRWPAATPSGDEIMEFGPLTRATSGWRATSLDFLDTYFG